MRLIGRRNFVRGLGLGAGAALLTPFARSIIAEASGIEGAKRWVLMHDDHGLGSDTMERWIPSAPDLTQPGALPSSFEPLAPWASRMLILDRFDNPFNVGQHGNGWASLSATSSVAANPGEQQSTDAYPSPGGITIDVFAGEQLGDVPFRRLGFGTDTDGHSSDAQLNPVPDLRNSQAAFDQILGGLDPEATEATLQARLERQHGVLDRVGGDLGRLRSRLAGPEREKLDQLEASIEDLEAELDALADAGACTLPAYPPDDATNAGPKNGEFPAGYFKAMVAIARTALVCRLTNVIVLRPSPGRRNWNQILNVAKDKHQISHDNDDATLSAIDRFNASHLVDIISALELVPEGDGTMLDNTLVTWMDSGGGRHHAGAGIHPVITIGNPQGSWNTGRFLQFSPSDHKINDVFVTMLQALGIDVDTFGDPSACKGPLPGLA